MTDVKKSIFIEAYEKLGNTGVYVPTAEELNFFPGEFNYGKGCLFKKYRMPPVIEGFRVNNRYDMDVLKYRLLALDIVIESVSQYNENSYRLGFPGRMIKNAHIDISTDIITPKPNMNLNVFYEESVRGPDDFSVPMFIELDNTVILDMGPDYQKKKVCFELICKLPILDQLRTDMLLNTSPGYDINEVFYDMPIMELGHAIEQEYPRIKEKNMPSQKQINRVIESLGVNAPKHFKKDANALVMAQQYAIAVGYDNRKLGEMFNRLGWLVEHPNSLSKMHTIRMNRFKGANCIVDSGDPKTEEINRMVEIYKQRKEQRK